MLTKEQKQQMAESYADRFYDRNYKGGVPWHNLFYAYFAGLDDAHNIFSLDIILLKNTVMYLREKLYLNGIKL